MEIRIPATIIPVLDQADVIICGGGCAGIAAAVSSARHGCRVILLERWPTIGGMATNALVNGWHRSDREKVVINGLVEESARRAVQHGWIRQDPKYPHAHETHWFEPEGMRIVWQRMLDEAGVKTICNLAAGEPLIEHGRMTGVLVDSKRGRRAILGRMVVDATGDGDVAAKAGLDFEFGRASDGCVQCMTLMFALRNVDETTVRAVPPGQIHQVIDQMVDLRKAGEMPPFNEGNARALFLHWGAPNHLPWNMCPVTGDPLDEQELSRLTALAHEYRSRPNQYAARRDQLPYSPGDVPERPATKPGGGWALRVFDPRGPLLRSGADPLYGHGIGHRHRRGDCTARWLRDTECRYPGSAESIARRWSLS